MPNTVDSKLPRVLVVDHNEKMCSRAVGFLNTSGFRAESVLNAKSVLHYIKNQTLDLVLLDVDMPITRRFVSETILIQRVK